MDNPSYLNANTSKQFSFDGIFKYILVLDVKKKNMIKGWYDKMSFIYKFQKDIIALLIINGHSLQCV